ncbi:MAG TPA: hypothetical protein VGO58_07330 [Chitinophagaceae bacterium]|jgi:hypothetical protein|nr:hypothetical protein [Chitinophagaceae bacterium]
MKSIRVIWLLLLTGLLYLSCKSNSSYAIRDFESSLQPHLVNIVSEGIIGHHKSIQFIEENTTDGDLQKLARSEHPALRAVAFSVMLKRSSINHFKLIMNNLADTAIVALDWGEFGIRYRTVSDYLLDRAEWDDTISRNQTINAVLTKHNYLHGAYSILLNLPAEEKYYPFIKEMAQRKRSEKDFFEPGFKEEEYALFGLAKFGKKEDVNIIKDWLLENRGQFSHLSFRLMKEFPNEAYHKVFQEFYLHNFYPITSQNQYAWYPEEFVESLAVYKNETSSKILSSILGQISNLSSKTGAEYLKQSLVYAICNNPCDAYSTLRMQIADDIKNYEKREKLVMDTIFQSSSQKKTIRW